MSSTVLDMSMSLDGFITGPNEGPDNPLGDGVTGSTNGCSAPTLTRPSTTGRHSTAYREATARSSRS